MTAVPHLLTDQDRALLRDLRHRHADFRHKATEQRRRHPQTPGQRIADLVASAVGSWRFLIVQSVLLGAWTVGNAITGHTARDPARQHALWAKRVPRRAITVGRRHTTNT